METGIGVMYFGQPGSGIMRIALDGPTSAVSMNSAGIAITILALDQIRPRKASEVNIDRKSSDQRYDNCVVWIAPDKAPNGTKPRVASDRTMKSTISTIDVCISNS
jgi:hypothetical protein